MRQIGRLPTYLKKNVARWVGTYMQVTCTYMKTYEQYLAPRMCNPFLLHAVRENSAQVKKDKLELLKTKVTRWNNIRTIF